MLDKTTSDDVLSFNCRYLMLSNIKTPSHKDQKATDQQLGSQKNWDQVLCSWYQQLVPPLDSQSRTPALPMGGLGRWPVRPCLDVPNWLLHGTQIQWFSSSVHLSGCKCNPFMDKHGQTEFWFPCDGTKNATAGQVCI